MARWSRRTWQAEQEPRLVHAEELYVSLHMCVKSMTERFLLLQDYVNRLTAVVGPNVELAPEERLKRIMAVTNSNLSMFSGRMERQKLRLFIAPQLDQLRWNILGPQLYTQCSKKLGAKEEDVALRATALANSGSAFRGCTVQDLEELCELKSYSGVDNDVREGMFRSTTCSTANVTRPLPSDPASLNLKVFARNKSNSNCQVDHFKVTEDTRSRLVNTLIPLEQNDRFELHPATAALDHIGATDHESYVYYAMQEAKLCGVMLVNIYESKGYAEIEELASELDPVTKRGTNLNVGKMLVSSLVDDLMMKRRKIFLLKLTSFDTALGFYYKLGFTTFDPLPIVTKPEGLTSAFMDLNFSILPQGYDVFRAMYHCILQGNPRELWYLLSVSVKPKLMTSAAAREAWMNHSLFYDIVSMIAFTRNVGLFLVYMYFYGLAKTIP